MIYPYKCTKCEHVFEVERKMSERRETEPCEKCGADSKQTFIASKASGFHLKGHGWAKDNYGNKPK